MKEGENVLTGRINEVEHGRSDLVSLVMKKQQLSLLALISLQHTPALPRTGWLPGPMAYPRG